MSDRCKDFDDYSISYIKTPPLGEEIFAAITGKQPSFGEETAIVHADRYFILRGDHFDALCALPDLAACKAYFEARPAERSQWSD